jgi:hypothetical protein
MTKRRLFASAVAVLGLAFGGVVIAVPGAQAEAGTCPSGYFCIWRDHDYQSNGMGARVYKNSGNVSTLVGKYFAASGATSYPANDGTSSMKNGGQRCKVTVYKDAEAKGSHWTLPLGGARNNLLTSWDPIGFNDVISSFYWC